MALWLFVIFFFIVVMMVNLSCLFLMSWTRTLIKHGLKSLTMREPLMGGSMALIDNHTVTLIMMDNLRVSFLMSQAHTLTKSGLLHNVPSESDHFIPTFSGT